MNSTEFCVIITTTDNLENANEIASYLIENRLAACVQLEEVLSSFYWEEKLCQSKEFRLMIKTLSNNYRDIEKAIINHHNYSLMEIIKLDITSGLPQYLNWVRQALT
jgi:periplasmic divalent cation tolerance protein